MYSDRLNFWGYRVVNFSYSKIIIVLIGGREQDAMPNDYLHPRPTADSSEPALMERVARTAGV